MNKEPLVCVVLFATLWIVSSPASAQETHRLTLKTSVERGLAKGFLASDVTARYLASKRAAESALRKQWTSVSLDVSAPDFTESLSQQFNPLTGTFDFFHLKQTTMQGALTISQPLSFTGGTIRVSELVLRREQSSGLVGSTQDLRDYFGSFAVEIDQPLLTPNLLRISALRASLSLEQAETDFLQQQTDLVYAITQSYYNAYQLSRRLAITGELVRQNEESYQTALSKSRIGLIPEVEALQSEVDLATSRNDSLTVAGELSAAKNALRLLLGIPTADEIEVAEDVAFHPAIIDEEQATGQALTYRSEVLSASRDVTLREADVDQARSLNGFRIDLTAQYGLNRDDQRFVSLFQNPNASRAASLRLSIPIFDWGSASLGVESAEIQYRNSRQREDYVRQQVKQEVLDLVNRIRAAESRLHVLEKTTDVAQKSYDISLSRFRNGTISRNDLAQAQQRLTQAKTTTLAALIDYELGMADLTRKTLWDFAAGEKVQPLLPDSD